MIAKIIVDNKSKQVDKPFDYLVPKELQGKIKYAGECIFRFITDKEKLRLIVYANRIKVAINLINP